MTGDERATRGSGMSELSREQVEALQGSLCPDCGHGTSWHHGPGDSDSCSRTFGQALAPTVAAMLAEAEQRGENRGRAEGWDEGKRAAFGPGGGEAGNPYRSASAGAPE